VCVCVCAIFQDELGASAATAAWALEHQQQHGRRGEGWEGAHEYSQTGGGSESRSSDHQHLSPPPLPHSYSSLVEPESIPFSESVSLSVTPLSSPRGTLFGQLHVADENPSI